MNSKINDILKEMEAKKQELKKEYEKLKDRYDFSLSKGKVVFGKRTKKLHKKFKQNLGKYIIGAHFKHLISMPFIYGMIIPFIILDIGLFVYQQTAFRLYGIPLVKRKDYIIFDRRHLNYLNLLQKFHCIYCSYGNGILGYGVEIAGRTEKYWCPIKHAKKMKSIHDWQKHFSDYGDAEGFKEVFNSNKEFKS